MYSRFSSNLFPSCQDYNFEGETFPVFLYLFYTISLKRQANVKQNSCHVLRRVVAAADQREN